MSSSATTVTSSAPLSKIPLTDAYDIEVLGRAKQRLDKGEHTSMLVSCLNELANRKIYYDWSLTRPSPRMQILASNSAFRTALLNEWDQAQFSEEEQRTLTARRQTHRSVKELEKQDNAGEDKATCETLAQKLLEEIGSIDRFVPEKEDAI